MADEKKLIPFTGFDQAGIIKDTPSHILAGNAFTDGRNIVFSNGSVSKRKGTTKAFDDISEVTARIKNIQKGSGVNTARIIFADDPALVVGNQFTIADSVITGYNQTLTVHSIDLANLEVTVEEDLSSQTTYIPVTAANFNSSNTDLHPATASETTGLPLYFESSVTSPTPGAAGDTASDVQTSTYSKVFYFSATGGFYRYTGQIDFIDYWASPNENQYIEIQRNKAVVPNTTSFFSLKSDGIRRRIGLSGASITNIDQGNDSFTFERDPELIVGEVFNVIDCTVSDYNRSYTVSSISGNTITTTEDMSGYAAPPANDDYPNDFGRQINTSIFPKDYAAFQRSDWQSAPFLGGYAFIINNGYHTPQYILGADGNSSISPTLRPLPGWDWQKDAANEQYHIGAKVVRGYKNVLIAGNLKQYTIAADGSVDTIAEKSFPGTIRVSTAAAAGEIPRTWQPGSTNEFADEFEISTTSPIQDIVPLQGLAMIYTPNSIHSLQFDARGNASVQTVAEGYGALDTNCVIEFDGKHLVIGSDDIYLFGGHPGSIQSICENKIRDYFYNNINSSPEAISNLFMLRDISTDEIKIFYPTKNSDSNLLCDEYIAWNYRNNTWTINDADNVVSGTVGPLRGGGIASGSITFAGVGNASSPAQAEEQRIDVTLDTDFPDAPVEIQEIDYSSSSSTTAATLDTEAFNLEVRSDIIPYNEEQLNITFDSAFNSGNDARTIGRSGTNSTETNIESAGIDISVTDVSASKTVTTSAPQGNTLPQSNGIFSLGTISYSNQRFGWGGNFTASGRESWIIPSQNYSTHSYIKLSSGGTTYTDRVGGWLWPANQNVNNNYHEVLLTVRAERESGGGAVVYFPLTWEDNEDADATYRVQFLNSNGDGPGTSRFYISGAESGDTDESGVLTSSGSTIREFVPGRGNTVVFYHQVPRDGGSSVSMAFITILAGAAGEEDNELTIPKTEYTVSNVPDNSNITTTINDNNNIDYSISNNGSATTSDIFASRNNFVLSGTVPATPAKFSLVGNGAFPDITDNTFPESASSVLGAQYVVDEVNALSNSNIRAIVDSSDNKKAKIYYRTETDADITFTTDIGTSDNVASASTSDFTLDSTEIKTNFSSYNVKVKDSNENLVSSTDITLSSSYLTPETIGNYFANTILAAVNNSGNLVNSIDWSLNNPGVQPDGRFVIRFETNATENYTLEITNTTSFIDNNITGISDSIVFTENLGAGFESIDVPDIIKIKGPLGNTFNSISAYSNEDIESLLTRLVSNFNSISSSGWSAVLSTTPNTITFTADTSGRYPIESNSTESSTYPGYGVFDIEVTQSSQNVSAGNLPDSIAGEITQVGAQDSVEVTLYDPITDSSTDLLLGGQTADDIANSLASKINSFFNNWTAFSSSNQVFVKSIQKDWVLVNRNPTTFDTTLINRAVYVSNVDYPLGTLGGSSNISSGSRTVTEATTSGENFYTREKATPQVGHPIIGPTQITLSINDRDPITFALPDGATASEMASATAVIIQSSVDGLNATSSNGELSISSVNEVAISTIATSFDDFSSDGNQVTISRSNGNNLANSGSDPFPSSDETELDPYTDLERPYSKNVFNLSKDFPIIATQSVIFGQNFGYTNLSSVYDEVIDNGTPYLSYVERVQLPISGSVEYTVSTSYTQVLADSGNVNVIVEAEDTPGATTTFSSEGKDFFYASDYKIDHRLQGRVYHIKFQDEGGEGKDSPWRISGYGFKAEQSGSRGNK